MRIQVTLRMPGGNIQLRTYENAFALVHPHSQVLQIFRDTLRHNRLIAEYHGDAYLSWEYLPPQPMSRANLLLLQHHGK